MRQQRQFNLRRHSGNLRAKLGVGVVSLLRRLAVIGSLVLLPASPIAAGAGALSAGAAWVDITPDPRMTNWVGQKPYDGVVDPVFARALVIAEGSNRVAILCWDLVDAREGAVAEVRRAITKACGIEGSHVVVNASHTHSAPWSPVENDRLVAEERKTLAPILSDPAYHRWRRELIEKSAAVVKQADAARRPATLAIARAVVPEVVFNRRPRKADGLVQTVFEPADPFVQPDGMRFGPLDPTLTVLAFRDSEGHALATLFHFPCHPVAVYPYHKGISADWPGTVASRLASATGGDALFVQGCAGDIVPARRGLEARDQMARLVADRAAAALKVAAPLSTNRLEIAQATVKLPLTEVAQRDMGPEPFSGEVQVIAVGPLAMVTLPGEPLIGLAIAIQARSPFPHTLVLGYSNGYGVQYVGLPGEKARGGYEMGTAGSGVDECGGLLVEAAVRLLEATHARQSTRN